MTVQWENSVFLGKILGLGQAELEALSATKETPQQVKQQQSSVRELPLQMWVWETWKVQERMETCGKTEGQWMGPWKPALSQGGGSRERNQTVIRKAVEDVRQRVVVQSKRGEDSGKADQQCKMLWERPIRCSDKHLWKGQGDFLRHSQLGPTLLPHPQWPCRILGQDLHPGCSLSSLDFPGTGSHPTGRRGGYDSYVLRYDEDIRTHSLRLEGRTQESIHDLYLCVLIHNLLQIFQQMIIRAALFLININYPVQVGKVPVQIYSLGIASTHKPVLELTGLKKNQREKSPVIYYYCYCGLKVSINNF